MSDEFIDGRMFAEQASGNNANHAPMEMTNQGGEQSASHVENLGDEEQHGGADNGVEAILHVLDLEELRSFLEYERSCILPNEPNPGFHIRWLFTMLMVHAIMRASRPEGSETSEETSAEDVLVKIRDVKGAASVPEALTAKRLSELSLTGSVIVQCCNEFGSIDCISYIGEYLTPDL